MPRQLENSYDQLVEKAQEIFWLKGFKGVSVKALSEHLEVSQSVLYHKYSKDLLFLSSLDYYTTTYSDPFLRGLRESEGGIEALRSFFYKLIEALLDRTFPRSCLMVNTVVELRNENEDVVRRYDDYLDVLKQSYLVVLEKAWKLGQFKRRDRIDDYAELLLGVIFSMSILYKLYPEAKLREYIDEHLSFIV